MPSAQSEFHAMLDLLSMLVFDWRTGTLLLLLSVAAVFDLRFHRIPNWLVLAGALFGVIYNTIAPTFPGNTILFPLAGIGMGLLLFLPLYFLRAMGAGDVKLLAMVGAFLGAGATVRVALLSIIAGGVLAIVFVAMKGTAPRLIQNLSTVFQLTILDVSTGNAPGLRVAPEQSAGRLPFGVAILVGTMGYLVFRQWIF